MKHLKEGLLLGIIALLCVIFLISATIDIGIFGDYARVLIFPLSLTYYIIKIKDKNLFFIVFLLFFLVAEVLLFLAINYGLLKKFGMTIIYLGTLSYIISYFGLLYFIVSKINLKLLFKRFSLHSIVLIFFGFYLIYALDNMLKHHGLASMPMMEYVLATVYNLAIILVLIFSLLSYLYHDTRKSLLLFIACLCIVFSELVQTAYYFMAREGLLDLVYTVLLSVGFLMLVVYVAYGNKSKSMSKSINKEKGFFSTVDVKDA